jgi:histidine triad (HIT) family protein
MTPQNCPFCEIIRRTKPAAIIFEDDQVVAFKDHHPVAPVHILVIPKKHFDSMNDISSADEALLGHMVRIGRLMAEEAGIGRSGYRLVINTGPHAGQSVFHLHLHVIGGKYLPVRFE